ncbi:MAG: crossover junction endodeoxyribonuclease RuvC [Butyricicoccus sp.]
MITILGIDPGYGTIGYGVVRFDNMKFTPVQYGAAKTAPGTPMHLRLCEIYDDICTLVTHFTRTRANEELFFENVTTGIRSAARVIRWRWHRRDCIRIPHRIR